MNLEHLYHSSPVGKLLLVASPRGLRALLWEHEGFERVQVAKSVENSRNPLLSKTAKELDEYFSGKRKQFTIPLDPVGTPFQLRVWEILKTIPYGKTLSYGEQATLMGSPQAARAVGGANGKNPISIIVPCHRVIGRNGKLTGFGGGLPAKQKLLEIESVNDKKS